MARRAHRKLNKDRERDTVEGLTSGGYFGDSSGRVEPGSDDRYTWGPGQSFTEYKETIRVRECDTYH